MGPAVQRDRSAGCDRVLGAVSALHPKCRTRCVGCVANLKPQILGSTVSNTGVGREIKHSGEVRKASGIDPAFDRKISANHSSGRNLVPAFRERQSPLPNPQGGGTGDGLAHGERLSDPSDSIILNIFHAAVLGKVVVVPADVVGGCLAGGADRVSRSQTQRWTGDRADRHGRLDL